LGKNRIKAVGQKALNTYLQVYKTVKFEEIDYNEKTFTMKSEIFHPMVDLAGLVTAKARVPHCLDMDVANGSVRDRFP